MSPVTRTSIAAIVVVAIALVFVARAPILPVLLGAAAAGAWLAYRERKR